MTDKQKELMAKYNRVAEDKSQLQQFCQDVIIGEIGGGGSSSFIEVTDENRESVFADIQTMLESIGTNDNQEKHYDVTYRFNGNLDDSAAMRYMLESIDPDITNELCEQGLAGRFQIITNGSYITSWKEDHIPEYGYTNSFTTSFGLSVAVQIDNETGDPRNVIGNCPRIFGDVRFVYDYEQLI